MMKLGTRTVEEQFLEAIVCDICEVEYDDQLEAQEFLTFSDVGGFGSVWGDGSKISLDVCQHCLFKLFEDKMRYEPML